MSDAPAQGFSLEALGQFLPLDSIDTPQGMRDMIDRFAGMMNGGLPEVGGFHEGVLLREVDGAAVRADIVVPAGEGPHPVLVYLHGGGWICGSPTTHRKLAHRFAEAGYLVVNVDYRLAPEAPFPAPFEDCLYAVKWAADEVSRFGGDASRLAIGGDSAGGNLSAAVAAALSEDPEAPRIAAALLIYGVFDFATLGEGLDAPVEGPMAELGPRMLELMVGSYLGDAPSESLLADPRVSPLHAASRLPPSYVVVGSADPLAAQAEALVERLAAAGTVHEHVVHEGMPHGYVQMEFFPQARQSIDAMVAFLDRHLGA